MLASKQISSWKKQFFSQKFIRLRVHYSQGQRASCLIIRKQEENQCSAGVQATFILDKKMVSSFYDYGQQQKKVRSLMETTLEMRRDKKNPAPQERYIITGCAQHLLTTLYHTSTLTIRTPRCNQNSQIRFSLPALLLRG